MMRITNVFKSYGDGASKIHVLKNVSLDISAGESLALVGKSGSGKSTLLSLMAGLDYADAGEIFLNNCNITKMPEKELVRFRAQHMGIVFQQFHLISTLSALENILLPLNLLKRPDALKNARRLLDSVGLSHRADHLPKELSGGESQRIAIARAMAIGPSIILADEPSGNLDEETGEKVMGLLFELVKTTSTTLVLVTHDVDLANKCSRTVHLEHGSLV
jgi:putative ABC transport system ATP-binding protein